MSLNREKFTDCRVCRKLFIYFKFVTKHWHVTLYINEADSKPLVTFNKFLLSCILGLGYDKKLLWGFTSTDSVT